MISFIMIGRNEGWKLTKCFESVFKTIEVNNLTNSEVIYVDSKSTDDSIKRAMKFPKIKIFQITGQCNAAIGRNIGAIESKGNVLFFIDGDMEIMPEFLTEIYSMDKKLSYPFVSGLFQNYYYGSKGEFLYSENYCNLQKDTFQTTTGGLFIITRKLWLSVEGMKTKYTRSEDLDLGLRLAEHGTKLLRKNILMAKHHTISYNSSSRMWSILLNCGEFYRSVLLREHFTNLGFHKKFIRENYTSILSLISLIVMLFFGEPMIIYFYLLAIFARATFNLHKEILRVPSRVLYFIVRDISIWGAFCAFWPSTKKLKYKCVK